MSVFIKGLNRFIKGMKMPKLEKTYKVRLYKAVDGRIIVTACGVKENVFQPVGEAVEVTTPHGRLIDKTKLKRDLFVNFMGERIPFYDCDNFPTTLTYIDLHSILSEQPTVIEAED